MVSHIHSFKINSLSEQFWPQGPFATGYCKRLRVQYSFLFYQLSALKAAGLLIMNNYRPKTFKSRARLLGICGRNHRARRLQQSGFRHWLGSMTKKSFRTYLFEVRQLRRQFEKHVSERLLEARLRAEREALEASKALSAERRRFQVFSRTSDEMTPQMRRYLQQLREENPQDSRFSESASSSTTNTAGQKGVTVTNPP